MPVAVQANSLSIAYTSARSHTKPPRISVSALESGFPFFTHRKLAFKMLSIVFNVCEILNTELLTTWSFNTAMLFWGIESPEEVEESTEGIRDSLIV